MYAGSKSIVVLLQNASRTSLGLELQREVSRGIAQLNPIPSIHTCSCGHVTFLEKLVPHLGIFLCEIGHLKCHPTNLRSTEQKFKVER